MFDDHVEFFGREVGQYGYGDHAGRCDGQIAYAPVGHVAAQQGDLVAGLQAGSEQQLLYMFDPFSDLFIGYLFTAEHDECRAGGKSFYAVFYQLVERFQGLHSVIVFAVKTQISAQKYEKIRKKYYF